MGFGNKSHLKKHIKINHKSVVPSCKFFKQVKCKYSSDMCWYVYTTDNRSDEIFKCRNCSNTYNKKKDLMSHRKDAHIDYINPCRKYDSTGNCKFGQQCWYIHKVTQDSGEGSKFSVDDEAGNLLKIMSEKIMNIENELKIYMTIRCVECGENNIH